MVICTTDFKTTVGIGSVPARKLSPVDDLNGLERQERQGFFADAKNIQHTIRQPCLQMSRSRGKAVLVLLLLFVLFSLESSNYCY